MGRKRKAWLLHGTGIRVDRGKRLPGFYVRFNEYASGRRASRSRSFSTLAFAERFVREHNAKAELKLLGDVHPLPIEEALESYFAGVSTLARDTKVHYATALGYLWKHCGSKLTDAYTGADIDRVVQARVAAGSSHATVAKHVRGLRRFFAWAIDRGLCTTNPVRHATHVPKGSYARVRPMLTDAMLERIVAHLDTEDRRLAVWLAATTGLDREVIARLTPGQIDVESGVIRAVRRKRRAAGQVISIPLHVDLFNLLVPRCAGLGPTSPLLHGLTRQSEGQDWWRSATRSAGCPHVWFRDLRAFAVKRGAAAGVPLADLSRMLGHSAVQTTATHYSLPNPAAARQLAEYPVPGLSRRRSATRRKPARAKARRAAPSSPRRARKTRSVRA